MIIESSIKKIGENLFTKGVDIDAARAHGVIVVVPDCV